MGESAALWRETGYQTSGARVERRQRRARRRHTPSKWLWTTKVKLRMYVPSWRTCLSFGKLRTGSWLEDPRKRAAGPKRGKVSRPYHQAGYGIHPSGDPVQSNVLTPRNTCTCSAVQVNGHAERWNPPMALSEMGVGGQAISPGGKDAPRSKGLPVMVRIG